MKSHTDLTWKPKPIPWNFVDYLAVFAFLIWCGAGLTFEILHITPETIAHWQISPQLRQFVAGCLHYGDEILILLAFINTHLHAARQWTAGIARKWAVIIVLCAYAIEAIGTKTSLPFGEYHYTGNFGPMIWLVPLTIPFAWHIVVTNALFIVRAILPHVSEVVEAALVGMICTTYDCILEPFATTTKHYWEWAGGTIPQLNYIAWFVLSAALVYFFAPTLSGQYRRDPRPFVILVLTVAIFIAGKI
jgi:uncharacterized membrane protein